MKWTIFGNRLSKVSFHQIFSRKYLSVSDLRTLFIHWMILFSFFSISSLFFIWTLFMAYPLVDETDSFHETVMNATKFFIMNTTPSWSENYCAWTLNFCTILAFNLIARCMCACVCMRKEPVNVQPNEYIRSNFEWNWSEKCIYDYVNRTTT